MSGSLNAPGLATGAMSFWLWMLPLTERHVFWMSPPVRHRLATEPIHSPQPAGSLQYSIDLTTWRPFSLAHLSKPSLNSLEMAL